MHEVVGLEEEEEMDEIRSKRGKIRTAVLL
jgi:hypothetical protein